MALYRFGYGRVSSQDQNLERQYYLFEQIGVDKIYVEKISGGRRDRPEFLRLVEDSLQLRSQGHGVEIVVLDLTRWARDVSYALDMVDRLEKAGVKVREGTGEPVTMATAAGLLDVGVKSLFSHYFRLNLAEQARKTAERKLKAGVPHSCAPTFGYARKPDQSGFMPGPEWAVARAAVEYFLGSGDSLMGLSRWLYSEHGIKRSPQGLSNWLRNPCIRGHLHYPKTGKIIYDTHPALITESEYQAITQRLDLNRCLRGKNKGKIHAVPGIVYCGACGQKCSYSSNTSYRYFFCYRAKRGDCPTEKPRYIRQDYIEAAIQEQILEAAEAIAAAVLTQDTTDPRIAALEAEAAALEPFAGRAAIAAEIEAIELEVAQLKAAQGNQAAGAAEMRQQILDLAEIAWDLLSPEQRRGFYSAVVERVTVEGGEVVEVRVKGVG